MPELITKEMAWKPREDEVNIPVDKMGGKLRFQRFWFRNRNQVSYSTFLPKRFTGRTPVNQIYIGVFEGMDLVWCLQNILTHKDSRVIAIDPWEETRKITAEKMEEHRWNAFHNLSFWDDKVEIVRDYSQNVLDNLLSGPANIKEKTIPPGEWDIAVIDGDHRAGPDYEDAKSCLELVRVGGWLLFDDVRQRISKKDHVEEGVKKFVKSFRGRIELVWYHRYMNCYERIS